MSLAKITEVKSTGVYVPGDDIDTDRIIPARFMKCVTFDGLGEYAFYDVRFDEEGNSQNHPLDQHKSAQVLISGDNFGCGSSREHAPQALYHWGIRAVIAGSFAEIFFGNCTTLGIPCVTTSQYAEIGQLAAANPDAEITIDIVNKKIQLAEQEFNCEIAEEAHQALINGQWDPISMLLDNKEKIEELHQKLPAARL